MLITFVWPAAAQREAVLAVSKSALDRLETERRLFVRGRTLALAQAGTMLKHPLHAMLREMSSWLWLLVYQ